MIEAPVTAFLVFSRLAAMLMVLPVFSAQGVPKHVPGLTALILAALLAPQQPVLAEVSVPGLALALAAEVLMGVVVGLGAAAVFSALATGAEVASQQMGLAMASLFDPLTKSNAGLLSTFASMLGGLVFIGMGLHLRFLEILALSFQRFPPGQAPVLFGAVDALIAAVGHSIALGVQLAGPILALVWLINVFVAILARLAPRMNVFFSVGMSLGSSAGVIIFALALPWILLTHAQAMEQTVVDTARMLGL